MRNKITPFSLGSFFVISIIQKGGCERASESPKDEPISGGKLQPKVGKACGVLGVRNMDGSVHGDTDLPIILNAGFPADLEVAILADKLMKNQLKDAAFDRRQRAFNAYFRLL